MGNMPRVARRYDIYLPLTFNDGRSIPNEHFDSAERVLLRHFGGITVQQRRFPLRGAWQSGSQVYLDQVIVLTVLDFRPRGSTLFIGELKRKLMHDFDQLEILITESSMRVH
jgi:hypothetical protein